MIKKLLIALVALLPLTASAAEESYSIMFATSATLTNLTSKTDAEVMATIAQGSEYVSAIPAHKYIFTHTDGYKFGNYASPSLTPNLILDMSEDGIVPCTKIELLTSSTSDWMIGINGATPSNLSGNVLTLTEATELKSISLSTTLAGQTHFMQGIRVYYDGNAQKAFDAKFPFYEVVTAGKEFALMTIEEKPAAITWTSSDPAVATVNEQGIVTGLAEGKTTVTAKWTEDEAFTAGEASLIVYVTEGEIVDNVTTSITFVPSSENMPLSTNTISQYIASGQPAIDTFTEVTQISATSTGLKFGSSSATGYLAFKTKDAAKLSMTEKIVLKVNTPSGWTVYVNNKPVVENSSNTWDGTYTFPEPVQISSIYITGRYYILQGIDLITNPNIPLPEEDKIVYNPALPESLTVHLDEPYTLKPAEGNVNLAYSIANPEIATISEDGVIEGLKTGSTQIILTWGNNTYKKGTTTVSLTVAGARTPQMYFSNVKASTEVGLAFKGPELTVIPPKLKPYVRYSSSDAEVAVVSSGTGVVLTVAPGETVITATLELPAEGSKELEDVPFEILPGYRAIAPASYTLTVSAYAIPNNLADATDIVSGGHRTITDGIAYQPLESLMIDGAKIEFSSEVSEGYEPARNAPAYVKLNEGDVKSVVRLVHYNDSGLLTPRIKVTAPEGRKIVKIVFDDSMMKITGVNPVAGEDNQRDPEECLPALASLSSGSAMRTFDTGLPGVNAQLIWMGAPVDFVEMSIVPQHNLSINYIYLTFTNITVVYEDEYNVDNTFRYTVYPTEGSTVTGLDHISVCADEIGWLDVFGDVYVTNGTKSILLNKVTSEIGADVGYELSEPITEPGLWTMTISNEDYTFETIDGKPFNPSNDIRATWNVIIGTLDQPAISPEAGTVDLPYALDNITLTFAEGSSLDLAVGASARLMKGTDVAIDYAISLADNVATLTAKASSPLENGAEYKLEVSEGAFVAMNGLSPAITADYTYAQKVSLAQPAINPEPGTLDEPDALNTVTLTFAEGIDPVLASEASAKLLKGTDVAAEYDLAVSGNVLTLTAKAPVALENGDYRLEVSEGALINADGVSPAVAADYTYVQKVSVSDLFEAKEVTVHTLDGVLLLKSAPAAALKDLAPGLYLINGRTCLLR